MKSFDVIPTARQFLPGAIDLLMNGGPAYLHSHCDKRHKLLGPIFKERLGPTEMVFLSDVNSIQTVLANEGQYPHHNVPEAWSYYNEVHNISRGLFFQVGEPWAKLRRVFNKIMLANPHSALRFAGDMYNIDMDFLDHWSVKFRKQDLSYMTIPDVKAELCKWSIESTGVMLFGTRMGCVPNESNKQFDSRADELVRHVSNMFTETSKFQMLPVRLAHRLNLAIWRRFEEATKQMLQIANSYVFEQLTCARKCSKSNSILSEMIESKSLDDDEISRSIVDLIIASADTTSNSLQWALYLLAKHQSIQSRIYDEVETALGGDKCIERLKERTPFLRAFIKETFRLYPTAPFLARTLDRDIALNGYRIPAGKPIVFSLYTTGRSEKYFDEPLELHPERWMRTSQNEGCPIRPKYAYATLPFGAGSRMCIGRWAAELQMTIFLAAFVHRFQSYLPEGDDTSVKLRMILGPKKPICLHVEHRNAHGLKHNK